ncbi:MAG: hypothetical protein L0H63_07995, partial [Nitrococcus sp.]|nr:hypothetical protein [Nitrococcus sp.]
MRADAEVPNRAVRLHLPALRASKAESRSYSIRVQLCPNTFGLDELHLKLTTYRMRIPSQG